MTGKEQWHQIWITDPDLGSGQKKTANTFFSDKNTDLGSREFLINRQSILILSNSYIQIITVRPCFIPKSLKRTISTFRDLLFWIS